MTAPQPEAVWLGHRDLCSLQWSEYCDCEPPDAITGSPYIWSDGSPVDPAELDAQVEP